jgi:hypothetical protein
VQPQAGTIRDGTDYFPATGRIIHGKKILEEGIRQRQARDEETQGRHAEERTLRPQGQEPQAGDRDRPVRSAGQGQESAEEGIEEELFEEKRKEAQGLEEEQVEAVRVLLIVVMAGLVLAIHVFR